MKKKMWMAGLLAVALLLISCSADPVPEWSDEGSSAESSSAVLEATSSCEIESDDASSFVLESSTDGEGLPADESEVSTEPADESSETAEPEESSKAAESDESVASSEPAESSQAAESETSKQQPTETGSTHKHSYKSTVVKPNCTEKGYTLHKCSCGDSYTDNEEDAWGHNMIVVDIDHSIRQTNTTRGSTRFVCDNRGCGYYEDHETYSLNELALLLEERFLYYINLYRAEAGVPPVTLSPGLCKYAQLRSQQTYAHDYEEAHAAATALQYGNFYEYADESHWEVSCAEVITQAGTELPADGFWRTVDDEVKGILGTYRSSSKHWAILMDPKAKYVGIGQKGHNCIVFTDENYDEGYYHVWDFGDGNCGQEWIER